MSHTLRIAARVASDEAWAFIAGDRVVAKGTRAPVYEIIKESPVRGEL